MELRQRSQRPSEPSNQSSNQGAPQWQHQRQTSENNIGHTNANMPPPPPRRSPSVPSVGSSPMFHNPNSYSSFRGSAHNLGSSGFSSDQSREHGGSLSNSTNSIHSASSARYPRQSSYSNPNYTAPPAAPGYGRSHTEPFYQVDAVANSYSNMPASPVVAHRPSYSYSGQNLNSSMGSNRGMAQSFSSASSGGYDNQASGYVNTTGATNIDMSASNDNRGYGGYTSHNSSLNNPTPPTSSNYINPYKASKKSFKCASLLSLLLYLSILLLGGSTMYLRRAIKVANAEIETAHHQAHRRHLTHVKKTGGRHGPGKSRDAQARENQQREIERYEKLNAQIQTQIDAKADEYNQLQVEFENQHGKLEGLEATKQNSIKAIEHQTNTLDTLRMEKEELEAMLLSKEKLDEVVVKREEALWKRVERLTSKIGRESEREALDWFQNDYGTGPYKVEIELSFPHVPPEDHPNPHSWERISRWIVVELAPLNLMPHSVNMFLRQVHHKMWDGMTLLNKDEKKLQFGPNVVNGEERKFGTNFSRLLYQEYSAEYPHQQWTIGYAGRPAGPDFFINLQDNSQEFGPTADKHSEASPCFGKVVEGFDTLERIAMIPHYGGEDHEDLTGLYEVKILHAFLIKPKVMNQDQQFIN